MTARAAIVEAARSWIGTPFQHQARVKGVGVDCVGLVIGVARELGLSNYDTVDYKPQPNPVRMREQLAAHLDLIPFREVLSGDVLWFRVEQDPQHLGIVSSIEPRLMMIHAFGRDNVQRCVEQGLGAFWTRRIAGCYRYRGVD